MFQVLYHKVDAETTFIDSLVLGTKTSCRDPICMQAVALVWRASTPLNQTLTLYPKPNPEPENKALLGLQTRYP